MNYEQEQIARLVTADTYAIKIEARDNAGMLGNKSTKWLKLTGYELNKIFELFATEEDDE